MISPYNYLRAFNGQALTCPRAAEQALVEKEKLIVAFRSHRDGSVELRWALHLPGAPPRQRADGASDIGLELYDAEGALIATANCRRPADRPPKRQHEDFQEVLPWFESVASVVVIRGQDELARWAVEDRASERLIDGLTVEETIGTDDVPAVRITWDEPETEKPLHYMLRFTPDEGRRWIPLSNGIEAARVEIESELLRGIEHARFQLAASTGFRTTLVDSQDAIAGPPLDREVTIVQPPGGTRVEHGDPVRLVGAVTTRLDGSEDSATAYWSSNRDGFLADGLRALASELSIGRHVLRLVVEDDYGGGLSTSVVIQVTERGGLSRESAGRAVPTP